MTSTSRLPASLPLPPLFLTLTSLLLLALPLPVRSGDHNGVYSPCSDATVQRSDGFSFGIAFASKSSFYYNNNSGLQLSPCDSRLSLSGSNYQLSVFRPKVDEISLLTVNASSFSPVSGFLLSDRRFFFGACLLALRESMLYVRF